MFSILTKSFINNGKSGLANACEGLSCNFKHLVSNGAVRLKHHHRSCTPPPAPIPKKPKIKTSFDKFWERSQFSKCCSARCKDAPPRFDLLYYKASDKLTRDYSQTWCEYPEIKVVDVVRKCKFEMLENLHEPIQRRPRKPRLHFANNNNGAPSTTQKNPICQALKGKPPRCRVGPYMSCYKIPTEPKPTCKKICTPYPAYSECRRRPPVPRHPTECDRYMYPICRFYKPKPGDQRKRLDRTTTAEHSKKDLEDACSEN